jgi:hypothetical protein
MFVQNTIFTIHPADRPCGQPPSIQETSSLTDSIRAFLKTNYPKQKLLQLVFDTLLQKDLINDDLYFKGHENVHIIDFIRYILNRFDRNDKPNPNIKHLLKTLQLNNVRLPNACVNNPIAKKILC